jgi:Na+-transporting NADH:ubiquinone oxidoreductase subunit NqrE
MGRATDKVRSKVFDRLSLPCTAIAVAVLGVAAFWTADSYGFSPAWVFAVGSGLAFFLTVGWGYRSKLRSPSFVTFFLAWMFVHVAVFLLVLGWQGFLYYLPLVIVELWIGYTVAIWLFGPPPSRGFQ